MGYKLPDGRYVDDQGKTWKNYNDAAAAATTRQRRAETEAELSRQRQLQLNAANKLEQGQLGKRFFGWVPGVGALQDRRMAEDAREKASADLAVHALQKQLAIHEGQMGEAPMPGAVQPGVEPKAKPPAVLSDDADARASEARRMLQQATPYWEREENQAIRAAAAEGGGPRAGQAGYAQRADIQAWMDAQRAKGPAGQAMVDRFLEQQKKRGLLEAPQPMPLVDQLATSQDAREAAAKGYQGQKLDQAMMAGAEAIEGSAPAADARFEDPNFGTEALRGMPVSPVDSVVGDAFARAAALSGYQQAPTTEAFAGASALPNMAFAGNGMTPDQSLQVDREQGVPGITTPISAPEETREMNLGGENALVRRYLNAIQGR